MRLAVDLRDALAVLGFASLVLGVAMMSVPAALIVAGVMLLALALAPTMIGITRGGAPEKRRG